MRHQLKKNMFPWPLTTTEGVCYPRRIVWVQYRHNQHWVSMQAALLDPAVPQDVASLDIHFGPLTFTFQSHYIAFSIYIH